MAQISNQCNCDQQRIAIAKYVSLLLALILLTNAVNAASDTQTENHSSNSFFSVQYENDLFVNKDHYYTSGIQLTMLNNEEAPTWLKNIAQWTPFYDESINKRYVQYTFGQKMFTPDNIKIKTLQVDDRPYAGYLYLSANLISHTHHSQNIDYGNQFEITLGLVGPSALAKETQAFAHSISNSPIPQGWQNQLNDEITFGLSYSLLSRVIKPISDNLSYGYNQQVTMRIGNAYTYASLGAMYRLGDNLRQDLSPPNIHPGFPGLTYFKSTKKLNWYIFLGFEARLVGRNIFLDGNTFSDSHSVKKKPLIGDIQYGIVFIFDEMRIAISSTSRTKEYTTQKDFTNYGAINFAFYY